MSTTDMIDRISVEADVLEGLLTATVDSAYAGRYDFSKFESAFDEIVLKSSALTRKIHALEERLYEIRRCGNAAERGQI